MIAEPTQSTALKRDLSVDFLKGILILLMVFGHIPPVGSRSIEISDAVSWVYTFHMPIFVIVSGYFFYPKIHGPTTLHSILRSLVLPYLMFEVLYLSALYAVQSFGLHTSNEPPQSISNFVDTVLVHPLGAFWFIHALVVMQASFAIAAIICSKLELTDVAVKFGTYATALMIIAVATKFDVLRDYFAVYFLIGVILRALGVGLALPLVLAMPLVLISGIIFSGQPPQLSFIQLTWNLGIMGTILAVAKWRSLSSGLLPNVVVTLGKNTLAILIFHAFFVVAMRPFSQSILRVDQTGILYSILTTTIALAGCLLAARMIDSLKLSPAFFGQKKLYTRH